MIMRIAPKEAKMNRAEEREPHSRVRSHIDGSHGKGSDVGNERKADVRGAQEGGSMAEASGNPLSHAKHELKSQHPHEYHEHGPHHGTRDHIRHKPLHGMKPSKGYSR